VLFQLYLAHYYYCSDGPTIRTGDLCNPQRLKLPSSSKYTNPEYRRRLKEAFIAKLTIGPLNDA